MIYEYALALDIGKFVDHAAISITGLDVQTDTGAMRIDDLYQLRHLERLPLGTPYREIVEKVCRYLRHPELVGRTTFVMDRGQVGAAVVEMFEDKHVDVTTVNMTSGKEIHPANDGGYNVPKVDLVSALQSAFGQGAIKVSPDIPEDTKAAFRSELEGFQMKVRKSGMAAYEAAVEELHDDLVLSVSIGVWYLHYFGMRGPAVGMSEVLQEWKTFG